MADFYRPENNVTASVSVPAAVPKQAQLTETSPASAVQVQETGKQVTASEDQNESRGQGILPPSENAEHRSTLKKIFGELPVQRLQKVIRILQEMAEAKEKEELENERKKTERQEKMLDAVWMLKQSGISPEDFRTFMEKGNMENAIQNSRYVYTDARGMKRFWSGKGKIPSDLAEIMKRDGTSKEDYLRRGS